MEPLNKLLDIQKGIDTILLKKPLNLVEYYALCS